MRGTTPTHTFTLPIPLEGFKVIRIVYAQNDKVIVRKDKEDCEIEGNKIVTRLTQRETLRFDDKEKVEIQIRFLTYDGEASKTEIKTTSATRCLDDEVLV